MNHKKFIFIIIVVSLIVVLIHGAYKYVTEGSILGGTIFAFSLIIGNLINQITWRDPNGVSEESQDEMGQQIKYKSFKVAYFFAYMPYVFYFNFIRRSCIPIT